MARSKKGSGSGNSGGSEIESTAAQEPVTIGVALMQAEWDNGNVGTDGKLRPLRQNKVAESVGLNAGQYGGFRKGRGEPALTSALRLASVQMLSIEELIDRDAPAFLQERAGLRWRLAAIPRGPDAKVCRVAAAKFLARASPAEIEERVNAVLAARGLSRASLSEADVRDMVHGGLELGLVQIALSEDGKEAVDEPLAEELADALAAIAPGGRRPSVHVVRNVAHESFRHDTVAPFLIALVAHRIVARHLRDHKHVYDIGLAGGIHCATFVGACGAESSPFPDDSGDKRLMFVPLTLEPFRNHNLPMADATVAKMVGIAGALLGPKRISSGTFQSFGFVIDERIPHTDETATNTVRDKYRDLDIAIFGCGDREWEGWLRQALWRIKIDADAKPVTDICLNLLDEDGDPIPLPDQKEFIGVGLGDIRRLVNGDDKLALLLTSGRAKGLPITVAARAGCTGTLVCDQDAARAALDHLAKTGS